MNISGDAVMALRPSLIRYVASRLPSEEWETAEDIVSDAILLTLTSRRQLDDHPYALKNWLLVVARNLVASWFRRRAVVRFVPLDSVDFEVGRPGVGDDGHVGALDLYAAVAMLHPRDRELAAASITSGRPLTAAARMCGKPKSTAAHQSMRIRAQLRPLLEAVS